MKTLLSTLLCGLLTCVTFAQDPDGRALSVVGKFKKGTALSLEEYGLAAHYAASLARSTNRQTEGLILLDTLSMNLAEQIRAETLCGCSTDVKRLGKMLSEFGYNIQASKRPNNALKLFKNAHDLRFDYIYSRLIVESYFIPLLLAFLLGGGFAIANYAGKINWRYRKQFSRFTTITTVSGLVVAFGLACFAYQLEQICLCEWLPFCR